VLSHIHAYYDSKVPLNNERLDLFFRNNKFLADLQGQTDIDSVHEIYKVLTLKKYAAGQTVLRYGQTGDECYFVISGIIKKLTPVRQTVMVKQEEDLVKYYAEHADEVIWETVEDAAEMQEIVRLYKENPSRLDFEPDRDDQPPPEPTDVFKPRRRVEKDERMHSSRRNSSRR